MSKIPEKIKLKGVDPLIYLAAIEFHDTAIELRDKKRIRAEIVNYSFAIELYFKCLLAHSEYKLKNQINYPEYDRKFLETRGHRLNGLFEKLNLSDQENLIRIYHETYGFNLQNHLSEISDAFNEYRYSHEKELLTTNLTALKNIPRILRTYIEDEMTKGNYAR